MEEEQDRVEKGMDTDQFMIMIPKIRAFSEDRRNPRPEITRVCEECGKVFSSGKAYGGHKRIHNQLTIKEELIPETVINYNSDGEDLIRCSECGRGFPTWKSLFGHMRSHPERTWRGIRNPAPAPAPVRGSYCNSSSSTLSWEDDENYPTAAAGGNYNLSATAGSSVDLMKLLKGSWAATGKRGRSAITNNPGNREEEEEEEDEKMKEGVNDLLVFAKIPQPNFEEDPELSKQTIKKRRLEEFSCDICNKQFSSHQALGGHKASHNNKLRKPETDWLNGGSTTGETEQHKCNICGLIFSTGQALGGHKRRHWIGSPAGSSSQGTVQVRRPVLEFDLNDPPPPAPVEDFHVNAHSASLSNSISD